jgi:hypothetical protein
VAHSAQRADGLLSTHLKKLERRCRRPHVTLGGGHHKPHSDSKGTRRQIHDIKKPYISIATLRLGIVALNYFPTAMNSIEH